MATKTAKPGRMPPIPSFKTASASGEEKTQTFPSSFATIVPPIEGPKETEYTLKEELLIMLN